MTGQARYHLSEFVRQKKLIGQTRLNQNVNAAVACRFENRVLTGRPSRKEIISQFHPLVRFISQRIKEAEIQLRPAVSVKISSQDNLPPFERGIYVLAVSLWFVQGLRDVEKLVHEAVLLDQPDGLLGEDAAERLATACALQGRPWLEFRAYAICTVCIASPTTVCLEPSKNVLDDTLGKKGPGTKTEQIFKRETWIATFLGSGRRFGA